MKSVKQIKKRIDEWESLNCSCNVCKARKTELFWVLKMVGNQQKEVKNEQV